MIRRGKNNRRSLGSMVGGGLVELAAVALLVALVSSGRLHQGISESAEPMESSPVGNLDNPWANSRDDDEDGTSAPDDRSTLWSSLPSWRDSGWSSSGGTSDVKVKPQTSNEPWDEQDVERELMTSAEALRNWLARQVDKAFDSLQRDIDAAGEVRRQ